MKSEVKNAILVILSVLLIIIVVYFVTALFLTKEIGGGAKDDSDDKSSGVSLSYDNVIIAGKTFSQSDGSYMVMFFSEKNSSDAIKATMSLYDSLDKETKLYKVNLDEAINGFVKSDDENPNASNANELKINKDTLITINNGTITSYLTEKSQILDALK